MGDLEKRIDGALAGFSGMTGTHFAPRRRSRYAAKKAPMFISDFAEVLIRRVNAGQEITPPVDAWYVKETGPRGKPERVKVRMLRGSCDYYNSRYDYAELVGGRTVTTTYLFPVKGYSKPQYALITDNFGPAHNWVSIPRGMKAEKLAEYSIELGK